MSCHKHVNTLACTILSFVNCILVRVCSSITSQINELSTRLDNMESSIRNDVRTILDIVRQQQQLQLQQQQERHLHSTQQHQSTLSKEHSADSEKPLAASLSLQPFESDFSLDLFGLDGRRQRSAAGALSVHRSISQPECANTNIDKSLLR